MNFLFYTPDSLLSRKSFYQLTVDEDVLIDTVAKHFAEILVIFGLLVGFA
jgi:hypothetical protein